MSALTAEADAVSGLFEPDVILPSQFFEGDKRGLRGGERKLMAALLADGIEEYIQVCARLSNLVTPADVRRSDALEWVHTKDPEYIFSFDNVCDCLGIDADFLRYGLARYIRALREKYQSGEGTVVEWKKIRRPRK